MYLPSFSKIKYWLGCDGPFYLKFGRARSKAAEEASDKGTTTHAVLETAGRAGVPPEDPLLADFEAELRRTLGGVAWGPIPELADIGFYKSGRECGVVWHPIADTVGLGPARGAEGYPTEGPGLERGIRGTIDILGLAQGRIILGDYKTGKPAWAHRPMELEQLQGLGYVLDRMLGKRYGPPLLAIGQSAIGRWWIDEYDVQQVRPTMDLLRRRILDVSLHELHGGEPPPIRLSTINELCTWCECKDNCPRWAYPTALGDKWEPLPSGAEDVDDLRPDQQGST